MVPDHEKQQSVFILKAIVINSLLLSSELIICSYWCRWSTTYYRFLLLAF